MEKNIAAKKKILMIEDDPFIRKIYRNKLTLAGFDFVEGINGEEGLNKARFDRPDLILLDLVLPRKDGFDVLIEIKKDEKTKDVPVIIVSVLGREADIKKALSMGAADYLVKAKTSLSDMVDKVKEYLQ